jgi:transposase InsO family protein
LEVCRHIDVSYINISGTFYYLCSVLDGCSRYIVNWDLRESMTGMDIEIILERARNFTRKRGPGSSRITARSSSRRTSRSHSDLGHDPRQNFAVLSSSNGKIERWHKSLKGECIRPKAPLSLEDARRLVAGYLDHYNNIRLNSAVGYITPKDMLAGRQQGIHAERDRKLEAARKQRQIRRQQAT